MDNKYNKIINKNPAESFKKHINTKQAWQKYKNNFKSGIKRRHRIDELTNNKEDKFDFKEKTKKDYSLSNTRIGKCLYRLELMSSEKIEFSVDEILPSTKEESEHYICSVYKSKDDIVTDILGSIEFHFDDKNDMIFIDFMKKEPEVDNFLGIVEELLHDNFISTSNGIELLPLNEGLVKYYKSRGYTPYITAGEDTYYRKYW